jgi:hypothetical protein
MHYVGEFQSIHYGFFATQTMQFQTEFEFC